MEAIAPVEIELSAGPGADNQAGFGAKDRVGVVPRIDRQITLYVKHKHVLAQPEHRPHLGEPLGVVLVREARHSFRGPCHRSE